MVANTVYSARRDGLIQWFPYVWETRLDFIPSGDPEYRTFHLTLLQIGLGISDICRMYVDDRQRRSHSRLLVVDWSAKEGLYYVLGLQLSCDRSQGIERYSSLLCPYVFSFIY